MIPAYKLISSHKDFKKWHASHKDWFLSYVFFDGESQVGFADKEGEKVTSFTLKDNNLFVTEDQEVFKEPTAKILKLDIAKVKLTKDKALEHAKHCHKQHYSQHPIMKTIIILQHLPKSQVYNITFVTHTFHTINCKVNAENGKILEHQLTSLFDFAQQDKKAS